MEEKPLRYSGQVARAKNERSFHMAREKPEFREQLERLSQRYPGREMIEVKEAAAVIGCDFRTLVRDEAFPTRKLGTRYVVPLVGMARWMAGGAA